MQSPVPSNYGTSPGRSMMASPSPQPVKETHTMMKDYDPMTGNKMINKYMVVRELGRGVHGKVKLCRDTITNELCAIKIVDKTTRRRLGRTQISNEQKIRREIAIMKKCIHPNVVRLIEVIDDPTARKIYLVLEYMEGGEVRWKDSDDRPVLPLHDARSIFRDVVLGLEYLHMQGIIHRDIKPANLLLSAEGTVKISDFGVSHFSEKNSLERDLEHSPIVSRGFNISQASPSTGNDSRHGALGSLVFTSFSGRAQSMIGISQPPDYGSPYQSRPSSMISQQQQQQQQQWGDDLELAKTAGSPAFFAPELCYASEFSPALSPALSSASQTSFTALSTAPRTHPSASTSMLTVKSAGPTRPPISKAIDIWALGVTLYCFIYGRCPFIAETEFELFNIIPRKQPSYPDSVPGRDSVDAGLKDLLSRLLEKDVFKRITLKEVKEHPWVIEDIQDPIRWRIETDPSNYQRVHVTEDEVRGAVTIMDKIKNRIRKLSVSIGNFAVNRRRSKSISSTYSSASPTTEHGPIPIIRSPNSGSYQTPPHTVNPMSLPERFHNYHSYSGPSPNLGPNRLERPNSVCSNTSSIDEVDEIDEHSGQSGSGSSAHNNTSYIGRRRLFNVTGQQQANQYHNHSQSLGQGQQHQYLYSHHHQQHQQPGYSQRLPSSIGQSVSGVLPHSLPTRRTHSDDQLDQNTITSSRPVSTLYSGSASNSRAAISMGHSGLSQSWVYSPAEVSPLSPAFHDQGEGSKTNKDTSQELTPRPLEQSIVVEEHPHRVSPTAGVEVRRHCNWDPCLDRSGLLIRKLVQFVQGIY
ncbi:hypothetical protein EDD11_006056 [Mortierella claussenii]|nr:hypothetical protein EDD11_006056 [Mortierella claussenii]